MRALVQRLGGMVVSPRRTLAAILAGEGGDAWEPALLAVLVTVVTFPLTVARQVLLGQVDPSVAFRALLSSNGFLWTRLMNEAGFCGVAAACFFVFTRLVGRPVRVPDALAAGAYLYVPMGLLVLVGGLLQRAGVELPWLPHHPLDGWWIYEGGRVHPDRFYLKLVVEMAWPTMAGLAWAWGAWRSRATPRAVVAPGA